MVVYIYMLVCEMVNKLLHNN